MKEIKDYQVKVRLTQTEKQAVQEFAAAHNITISELLRQALYRYLGGK